jgi:hypothetical protein
MFLHNTGLPLQPSDILYDLIDFVRLHTFDLRHVSELPMMRANAIPGSSLERRVTMMVGLINFMHQWRTMLRAGSLRAVTPRTEQIKFPLAGLKLCRDF